MKLTEGRYYRTNNGQKVGPMYRTTYDDYSWSTSSDAIGMLFTDDGKRYADNGDWTVVAEWTDEPTGPVRTVTRKEIVPGRYGRVTIECPPHEPCKVDLAFDAAVGSGGQWSRLDAAELRAAAATLTEIADALDEQANGAAE